jgi:predicted membrane protein
VDSVGFYILNSDNIRLFTYLSGVLLLLLLFIIYYLLFIIYYLLFLPVLSIMENFYLLMFNAFKGGALKKIASSGGVFRVKNHDFMPKNHIFSNFRGGARRVRPPWIRPCSQNISPCAND